MSDFKKSKVRYYSGQSQQTQLTQWTNQARRKWTSTCNTTLLSINTKKYLEQSDLTLDPWGGRGSYIISMSLCAWSRNKTELENSCQLMIVTEGLLYMELWSLLCQWMISNKVDLNFIETVVTWIHFIVNLISKCFQSKVQWTVIFNVQVKIVHV